MITLKYMIIDIESFVKNTFRNTIKIGNAIRNVGNLHTWQEKRSFIGVIFICHTSTTISDLHSTYVLSPYTCEFLMMTRCEQQPGSSKVAEGVFFFLGCIQISNARCSAEYTLVDERNNKPLHYSHAGLP
jgi:hypothetical protein